MYLVKVCQLSSPNLSDDVALQRATLHTVPRIKKASPRSFTDGMTKERQLLCAKERVSESAKLILPLGLATLIRQEQTDQVRWSVVAKEKDREKVSYLKNYGAAKDWICCLSNQATAGTIVVH